MKATVHGLAVGVAALCAAYNAAAWLHRRQRHLALNTVLYGAAVIWECCHVKGHLDECAAPAPPVVVRPDDEPLESLTDAA